MGDFELTFSAVAVRRGFIAARAMEDAVAAARRDGRGNILLGEYLIEKRILTREQVKAVLDEQRTALERKSRGPGDESFGRLAVKRGYITDAQVQEALRRQTAAQAKGDRRHVGEILVDMKALSLGQVGEILAAQKKHVFVCDGCRKRFNLQGADAARKYRCPSCGGVLTCPEHLVSAAVDESMAQFEEAPAPPAAAPPRAAAARPEKAHAVAAGASVGGPSFDRTLDDVSTTTSGLGAGGSAPPAATPPARPPAPPASPELSRSGPSDDPLIGRTISNCVVRRKLGQGGMGAVYLAEHAGLQKLFAIKVLPPDMANATLIERFYREARAACRLEHPNIVKIYDVGEDAGRHYIKMEFITGDTLKQKMQGHDVSMAEAVRVLREVCKGLAYAHKQGFVHRDIKPDNIMIATDRQVKILDFGLARGHGEQTELTLAGQVMGTPAYMSPEQCSGKKIDHRTDLYSLGTVFYQLATGRRPFTGDTPLVVIQKHINEKPIPAKKINPDLPVTATKIIDRMMAKDATQRYASAEDVIQDLDRLEIETGPHPAGKAAAAAPGFASRFLKAAAVLFVLGGLTVGGTWAWLSYGNKDPENPLAKWTGVMPAGWTAAAPQSPGAPAQIGSTGDGTSGGAGTTAASGSPGGIQPGGGTPATPGGTDGGPAADPAAGGAGSFTTIAGSTAGTEAGTAPAVEPPPPAAGTSDSGASPGGGTQAAVQPAAPVVSDDDRRIAQLREQLDTAMTRAMDAIGAGDNDKAVAFFKTARMLKTELKEPTEAIDRQIADLEAKAAAAAVPAPVAIPAVPGETAAEREGREMRERAKDAEDKGDLAAANRNWEEAIRFLLDAERENRALKEDGKAEALAGRVAEYRRRIRVDAYEKKAAAARAAEAAAAEAADWENVQRLYEEAEAAAREAGEEAEPLKAASRKAQGRRHVAAAKRQEDQGKWEEAARSYLLAKPFSEAPDDLQRERDFCTTYAAALGEYDAKRWAQAIDLFEKAQALRSAMPADRLASARAEMTREDEARRLAEEQRRQDEEKRRAAAVAEAVGRARDHSRASRWKDADAALAAVRSQTREEADYRDLSAEVARALKAPEGMVYVPGGKFLFGAASPDPKAEDAARAEVEAGPFYIDEAEVTNKDYAKFLAAMGPAHNKQWCHPQDEMDDHEPKSWRKQRADAEAGKVAPVFGVSWYDAWAYARWAGKALPTEKEWEKAASWDPATGAAGAKRIYPWGDRFTASLVRTAGENAAPAARIDGGRSPFLCYDMAGGVLEWTDDAFRAASTENQTLSGRARVLKGGMVPSDASDPAKEARATFRYFRLPGQRYGYIGFRCVKAAR